MIYFVYKIFIQSRKDYGIISHIKNLIIFILYKFFIKIRGKGLTVMLRRVTMRQLSIGYNCALSKFNMVIQVYFMG